MIELSFCGEDSPRLDTFLQQQYNALATGALHKYLRQNKIKLNGKKQPLGTRLQKGDKIRLYLPQHALEKGAQPPLQVLYEDDGLLAVFKPAGLATMGRTQDDTAQDTLIARVRQYVGQTTPPEKANGFTPLLCHRLDTGTSGVVLVAKNPTVLALVDRLIQNHMLEKTYTCVTVGRPKQSSGTLAGWLAKDAAHGRVRVSPNRLPGAKPVTLRYTTLVPGPELALLSIQLITGRTHQIRAQLSAAGTPILGDSKYGILQANRRFRCKYQCLCAMEVRFPELNEPHLKAYSGLHIRCEAPWFYTQMLQNGTLEAKG